MSQKTLRTCKNGHRYYKSSDCPVCPECEKNKHALEFMNGLAAPAKRALLNNGIDSLEKLAACTQEQVLAFHGFGKSAIPVLKNTLHNAGLRFKNDSN